MPEHMLVPVEWKAASPGAAGELDGYASVFGNVDQDGDVVLPGAFKKTLADWSRSRQPLPLIADHQLSTEGVIGSVRHAEEDSYGLRVKAGFSSTAKAQDIRTKMIEGHLKGMSFTYQAVKHFRGQMGGKSARFLQELKLFEATVSPFPINELATASAKAGKMPYGDVTYADPGYQADKQKRYPLDTEEHIRAAWSYINQSGNAGKYSSEHLALVKGRIQAAMKRIGATVSESASLDFTQFADAMRKALDISFEPAQKAAVQLLVAEYHFGDFSAGPDDDQATEDAAAPQGTAAKADYSSAFLVHPPEPSDGTLDPLAALENERTDASLDQLEAHINHALGRAS